jgi:hypothetical protein
VLEADAAAEAGGVAEATPPGIWLSACPAREQRGTRGVEMQPSSFTERLGKLAGRFTHPQRRRDRSRIPPLFGLAAAAVFIALAAREIELPGVYYDELFEVVPALAFVEGGLASAVAEIPQSQISIFGHPLPLMAQPYNGALKTMLFIPVAALFGITAASVRLFTVSLAALSLALYYLFARRLFPHQGVAAIGVFLLAVDPSFIFYSRVDFAPSVLMFLLKALALWLLADWWRTRRTRCLLGGTFALGLGVYDKITFMWVVAAVAVAALLVRPRGVRDRLDLRAFAAAVGAFLVGSLPLVLYNLSWPPRSLGPVLAGTTNLQYGNYQGDFGAQLVERGRELVRLLDGEAVQRFFGDDAFLRVPVLPAYVAVAAAAIAVLFLRRVAQPNVRPAMFVLLCGIGVLLATAITPGADTAHHLLLVYPFPHLAVAAVAVEVFEWAKRLPRRASLVSSLALASLLAVPPALGALQTLHLQERLQVTGGVGNVSDGIYRLDDYLLAHDAGRHIVVLDWGIYYNLVGLSDGRLHCTQLWFELYRPGHLTRSLVAELTQPEYRYVLHAPSATNFVYPRKHFFAAARRAGLRPRLEREIATRGGLPLFAVYRLEGRTDT